MKLCKNEHLGINFTLNSIKNFNDMISQIKTVNNNYNIAVGMFGNFYDKNKKVKLDQLKEFRNKLSSFKDIKMEYITDGDFYASAIVSNRGKVKIK